MLFVYLSKSYPLLSPSRESTSTCILEIFFTIFLAVLVKISKCYSCYKPNYFTPPEFVSAWSSQKWCFRFLKLCLFNFNIFLSFSCFMGPYWSKNSKTLLLPQIALEVYQTSPDFVAKWSSQKYCFRLHFKIFMKLYFIFFFTITMYLVKELS